MNQQEFHPDTPFLPVSFVSSVLTGLPTRLRVFLPAFGCLLLATLAFCLLVVAKTQVFGWESAELFVSVLAGPLAGLGAPVNDDGVAIAIGVATLLGMLAHPIWPSIGTGILTCLGFGFWLFCGLAITCIAV